MSALDSEGATVTSGGRLDTGDRDGHTGSSAIDRALDLLAIVVHARRPLTLAEIAAEAELPKPTAHRILRLLVVRNLLRQSHDRSYQLGSEMYALSGEALAQLDFAREARPAL
jgi:DNA-binding IclR family transcriptional regulator